MNSSNALKSTLKKLRKSIMDHHLFMFTLIVLVISVGSVLYLHLKASQGVVLKTQPPMITSKALLSEPNILNLTVVNIGNISYRITKIIVLDHYKNMIIKEVNLQLQPGKEVDISFRINTTAYFIKNNTYPILILTHRGIAYSYLKINKTIVVLPLKLRDYRGMMFIPHLYDWYFNGEGYISADFPVSKEITVIVSYNHEIGTGEGIISRYAWSMADPKRGAFDIMININGFPEIWVTNGSKNGLVKLHLGKTGFIALTAKSGDKVEVFDGVEWLQRVFPYNLSKNYYPVYIGRSHYVNSKDLRVETYFKGRIRYVILDVDSWNKYAIETLVKEFKVIKYPTLFLDPMLCNNTACYDMYFNKSFIISIHNVIPVLTDEIFIWRIPIPRNTFAFMFFPMGSKVYIYDQTHDAIIQCIELMNSYVSINVPGNNSTNIIFVIP